LGRGKNKRGSDILLYLTNYLNPMYKANEIVLVEDNESDAELTIRALTKSKICNQLIHLRDGEEALEYLFGNGRFNGRNVNDTPKLVLLDLKMPKVGGLEVLAKIKSDPRTNMIPVVVLTSSKEDKDIFEGYRLGVNSYIVKPVGFDNFAKAVAEMGFYWLLVNQAPK
jgi:two-component system, response regulator